MRSIFSAIILSILLGISLTGYSQQKIEKIQTLSKAAAKGYMFEANLNDKGNIEVVYNLKSGKDKVVHEVYEFDTALNLIGSRAEETRKPMGINRPETTNTYVYATVGGGSSFTILSTKLNLYLRTINNIWDIEKQRYTRKVLKNVEATPKNAENRAYNGNVSYESVDGTIYLLVSSVKSDKNDKNKEYSLLKVGSDLELNEFPITFDRPHVLTYSLLVPKAENEEYEYEEELVSSHDMIFVFAPTSGNLNEYTFVQMDQKGQIKHQFTVDSPNSVMAITAHNATADGTIYLCALSVNDKRNFLSAIGEYAPIMNPSYLKYGTSNYRMEVYDRNMEKMKFKEFLTIKIKAGKLEWMNATPIENFKSKLKTPPNQKGGYAYDGKRFEVRTFSVMPDEGFIITGQLKVPVFKPEPNHIHYKDLICLRIDNKGNLVSQFSYKPASLSDSKSLIFPIYQGLIPSTDSKSLYWVNYEVKATKGYSSFYNAYNGVSTVYANFYPAIGKIDLETNTISNFEVMGDRKFLLNRQNSYVDLPAENSRVYIGEDRKGKIILAKYSFQ